MFKVLHLSLSVLILISSCTNFVDRNIKHLDGSEPPSNDPLFNRVTLDINSPDKDELYLDYTLAEIKHSQKFGKIPYYQAKGIYDCLSIMLKRILYISDLKYRDNVNWNICLLRKQKYPMAYSECGYIYFSIDFLEKMENEDQLAGILAHEMAHVDLRSSYNFFLKRCSSDVKAKIFDLYRELVPVVNNTTLKIRYLDSKTEEVLDINDEIQKVIPQASQRENRAEEKKADLKALDLLRSSDYSANGYLAFFRNRINPKNQSFQSIRNYFNEIGKSHPSDETRVNYMIQDENYINNPQNNKPQKVTEYFMNFKIALKKVVKYQLAS